MKYGQFCPIAKANEVLGEKWTLLVVRELLMGGRRFNELQRGLNLISPTMLSKRLDSLEAHGLVMKKKIVNQKGYEYYPTRACEELLPVITTLGEWGMRWARSSITDEEYDVELLMLYLQRSIVPEHVVGERATIRFRFTDVENHPNWWITVDGDVVDICVNDPGREIDVYFTTTLKTMVDIWMGDTTYRKAMNTDLFRVTGPKAMISDIPHWMRSSIFAGTVPATEIR